MSENGTQFEQAWRRRFERFADLHDDDAGIAGWSDGGLATRLRRFLKAWERTPEARAGAGSWLDAGCGAGTYTRLLAADGRRVTAVDYSVPTVLKAKKRGETVDAGWAVADVTKLPFADGSFDGVLCFGVMQALSKPHDALRELRRVLGQGGVLWVDALNVRCLPAAWSEAKRLKEGRPAHLRYDEPVAFGKALKESGFDTVERHWVPICPARLRRLQPMFETSLARGALKAVPPLAAALSHSILLRASVR